MTQPTENKPAWQYSIATLMLIVTFVALGLASFQYTISAPVAIGGLIFILGAAHVLGNKLGTHLRDKTKLREQSQQLPLHARAIDPNEKIETMAAPSRLRQRSRLDRRILYVAAGGSLIGLVLGGTTFWFFQESTLSGWLLGTISTAVISGILSFLMITFFTMLYKAWTEATRE